MEAPCSVIAPRQDPEKLLIELDQVDEAIAAANAWRGTLEQRQSELLSALDKVTRPQMAPLPARVLHRGVVMLGKVAPLWSAIDIHLHVLRRLWREFPAHREAMARAVAQHGSSRRYVAADSADLFVGKDEPWIKRHSVLLIEGWHADTNLNVERIRTLLPAAVRAAGLRWGPDVRVIWRRTTLDDSGGVGRPDCFASRPPGPAKASLGDLSSATLTVAS